MVTDFDLHERTGVPVEKIRQWLRQHGYGGRPGQRIPLDMERKFVEAHGGRREQAAPPPRVAPSLHGMVANMIEAPAAPAPVPERLNQVLDETARRLRELQARQVSLEAQNEALKVEAENARQAYLQANLETARQAREDRAPPVRAPETSTTTLTEALERRGITGKTAIEALRTLVATDGSAERLLSALLVADATPLEALRPVCAVVTCREVAALRAYLVVPVVGAACSLCRGSDNRRWFRLLAARLEQLGRKRVLIVGGADDSRAEIERLAHEEPKLRIEMATDSRIDSTRARALVKSADVVAFWVGTEIGHSEAQPFRDAARHDPGVVVAATEPGGKGIASLARAIIEALEQQAGKPKKLE